MEKYLPILRNSPFFKGLSDKTGLILEGGAMRGMFTAGVLDVLMEQGITVDGMVALWRSKAVIIVCHCCFLQPLFYTFYPAWSRKD